MMNHQRGRRLHCFLCRVGKLIRVLLHLCQPPRCSSYLPPHAAPKYDISDNDLCLPRGLHPVKTRPTQVIGPWWLAPPSAEAYRASNLPTPKLTLWPLYLHQSQPRRLVTSSDNAYPQEGSNKRHRKWPPDNFHFNCRQVIWACLLNRYRLTHKVAAAPRYSTTWVLELPSCFC